ncbi:MAG: response regulator [Bacteroidales bacterium]|jgi:two-component SAPR family response regulator|nr:response regulator [Bacteroidales bacterium]
MNCIVVDDSEVVQKQIAGFVEKSGILTCCGTFANPIGIENCIEENNVSLIFLDIEMPQMSGFDFLDKYRKDVQIIVISGSRKYALESYNYDITDYLLKPISYERFLVAANKAVEKHILQKHLTK